MTNSEARKIFVTGVPKTVDLKVRVRQEIHELLANEEMRNLYLLGLERLQSRPEKEPKSWYQLSGIHGAPYTDWNGETGAADMAEKMKREGNGYCTHSSYIFLSWHRAYLALYEQCLHEAVMEVAKEFNDPDLDELVRSFRVPYWDWVEHPVISEAIIAPRVTIRRPTQEFEDIDNPLAFYRFKYTDIPGSELDHPATTQWSIYPTTIRWPSDNTSGARDEVGEMKVRMQEFLTTGTWGGSTLNLRDRLFMLLNAEQEAPGQTFKVFSKDKWIPNGKSSDYNSAEEIHNSMHLALGRFQGHMSHPSAAAFDPVFWLHHCNMDRIWALWQAIHEFEDTNWNITEEIDPNHPEKNPEVSWAEKVITEDTGLLPFRKDASSLWTSKDIKYPAIFNATYPELVGWTEGADRKVISKQAIASVRSLYGPHTPIDRITKAVADAAVEPVGMFSVKKVARTPCALTAEPTSNFRDWQAQKALATTKNEYGPFYQSVTPPKTLPTAQIPLDKVIEAQPGAGKTTHREYFANIRAKKFAFGGSFSVHLFIGQFTSDTKERPFDPNLVGSFDVFATSAQGSKCKNCVKGYEEEMFVTGQIPLTGALLDRIEMVGSLGIEDVTEFLKEHLHWRAQRADINQTRISRHHLRNPDDLVVSVTSCLVDVPEAQDERLVYRDWNPLPAITEKKTTGTGWNNTEGYTGTSLQASA